MRPAAGALTAAIVAATVASAHAQSSYGAPPADIAQRLAALVRIDNLFDARYQEVLGFPARGRTLWLGLRAGEP